MQWFAVSFGCGLEVCPLARSNGVDWDKVREKHEKTVGSLGTTGIVSRRESSHCKT